MPDLVSAGPGMRGQPRGIRSMPSESEKKKASQKRGGVSKSLTCISLQLCVILYRVSPYAIMEEKKVNDIENVTDVSIPWFRSNFTAAKCGAEEKYSGHDADLPGLEKDAQEKALVWKQDLRIVPLCAAIYLLCYLDRSNIGMFVVFHGKPRSQALWLTKYRKCQDS